MRAVVVALYREPVVFLGVIQATTTALAAAAVISGWIPVVSLAAITALQRRFVRPR